MNEPNTYNKYEICDSDDEEIELDKINKYCKENNDDIKNKYNELLKKYPKEHIDYYFYKNQKLN